jgi:hypothetical protein
VNCIHRAGCPKPDVCAEVGHCTSQTREGLEMQKKIFETLDRNRDERFVGKELVSSNLQVSDDGRVLTIFGVRYDIEIFRHLGIGPIGSRVEIMAREDGMVTLRRLPDETPDEWDRMFGAWVKHQAGLPSDVPLWPNPEWSQDVAMVAHALAQQVKAPAPRERMYSGVGHLEQTGYIPAGSAAERETSREPETCTEKDAARYEWLRENWKGLVCHTSCSPSGRQVDLIEVVETLGQDLDPQSLDHAIDAAMKADDERSALKTSGDSHG